MTICWVPVQTLLRHASRMIKGSVRIESDSPQEARRGINKPPSTDPFSMQLGSFDSLTGVCLSRTHRKSGNKKHCNIHNSLAWRHVRLRAKQRTL